MGFGGQTRDLAQSSLGARSGEAWVQLSAFLSKKACPRPPRSWFMINTAQTEVAPQFTGNQVSRNCSELIFKVTLSKQTPLCPLDS